MKTKSILTLTLLILASSAFAQNKFQVTVTGIKENIGTIRVALFSTEDDFLKKPVYGEVVKANGSEVTVTFENVPDGQYGVSVIHDENENGDMDSNIMGIPKEGFGFGNNAMGTFGPPSFRDASVKISGTQSSHQIKLRYM